MTPRNLVVSIPVSSVSWYPTKWVSVTPCHRDSSLITSTSQTSERMLTPWGTVEVWKYEVLVRFPVSHFLFMRRVRTSAPCFVSCLYHTSCDPVVSLLTPDAVLDCLAFVSLCSDLTVCNRRDIPSGKPCSPGHRPIVYAYSPIVLSLSSLSLCPASD